MRLNGSWIYSLKVTDIMDMFIQRICKITDIVNLFYKFISFLDVTKFYLKYSHQY